ncbi:MAG: phytanoyl-CoA dioxygenase family protein [Candidatus Sumerlaeaceae bacterium]
MDCKQMLAELGVHDGLLSDEEKQQLDRQGFLLIPNVLNPDQLTAFARRLDEIAEEEVRTGTGGEVGREEGTSLLGDLINKDSMFQVCYTTPKVLAAIAHILEGDMKLSSLNSRAALPGKGHQGLHADFDGSVNAGNYQAANSVWLVNDFTEHNGATRIVPGTHRSGKIPKDVMQNETDPHPDEIKVIAPAGTVIVFNAHTWHGGTLNTTADPRRATHCYFVRRNQAQQTNQRQYLLPETRKRLTPTLQYLLDVH